MKVDLVLKNQLLKLQEECQVTVHCCVKSIIPFKLRIWKNTFLVPHCKAELSELIHAENISIHPKWTHYNCGFHIFTLYFSGLPKECLYFDLIENINESGGFVKTCIKRNKSDVYNINFSYFE